VSSSQQEEQEVIRVVIIDDHPSYVHGLKALLETIADDIEVVGTATDARSGIEVVREKIPDVVVSDIRMPDREGIELVKEIYGSFPDMAVVILTASDDARDVYEAMNLGVRGFLLKETAVSELVTALRVAKAGDVMVSPIAAKALIRRPEPDGELDEREREILKLVAEGLGNGEIAKRMSVSQSTLKRNLRSIEDKINATNRIQAVVEATRLGLI
jgi:DNA-binding NarL/FixJ family response regulator